MRSYFGLAAPNGGAAFSAIATGEGGAVRGANQLSIYSDYNNGDAHPIAGRSIKSIVYRDLGTITASDVGTTISFSFDAKLGNLAGATTAGAFVKVLKRSDNSYREMVNQFVDTTSIGTSWTGGSTSFVIEAGMVGELLQIGFENTACGFEGSGVFYGNLAVTAVSEPSSLYLLGLGSTFALIRRRRS